MHKIQKQILPTLLHKLTIKNHKKIQKQILPNVRHASSFCLYFLLHKLRIKMCDFFANKQDELYAQDTETNTS